MANRTITALYDTRAEAEATRQHLRQVGVPEDNIIIEDASRAEADRDHLAALPDEDRHAYEEGLRRGGFLVTVHADGDYDEDAIRVLEETPALDFDERQDLWRASGWTGYQPPQTSSGLDAIAAPPTLKSRSADNMPPVEAPATDLPKPATRARTGKASKGATAPTLAADADEGISASHASGVSSLPSSEATTADLGAISPIGAQDGVQSGYERIVRAVRDARESKRVRSYSYEQPQAGATVTAAPAPTSAANDQALSGLEHMPTPAGSASADTSEVRMLPPPARSIKPRAAPSLGPVGAIIGLIAFAAAAIWALRGRSHQRVHEYRLREDGPVGRHPRYVANQVADPLFEDDRGAGTDGAYTGGMVGDRSLGSGPGLGGTSGT